MKQHRFFLFTVAICNLIFYSCRESNSSTERGDFKKYYDQYQVVGSFVLYDPQKRNTVFYNKAQYTQPFSPASTFKICNSLIGLETEVIRDDAFVIPWDSVVRNPVWDKDYDFQSAFTNSVVWYYQELARRVGAKQMHYWLQKANYGNKDTSGGIDQFWLYGGLRITPEQQIEFLQQLHDGKLPFSKRAMDIVKKMMIVTDTAGYTLRAKSGWGGHGSQDVGWYIGYLESNGNVYYFVNCTQIESKKLEDVNTAIRFDTSRFAITDHILRELKLIPAKNQTQ